jgi:hypothetical protein
MSSATPVSGEDSGLSRAWTERAAAMFPPAETPPIMKPLAGFAPSDSAPETAF